MIIPCNRCGKKLDKPDKRNAYYITEVIVQDDGTPQRKNLIICKDCKRAGDTVIW